MPIPETWISVDHLQGVVATILVVAATSIVDYLVQRAFGRKIFEPIWSGVRRKYKEWLTKRDKITTDYEFSIYLNSNLPGDAPREATSRLFDQITDQSEGDFEVRNKKWSNDGLEQEVEVAYENRREPFELKLNFIPDPGADIGRDLSPGDQAEPPIKSIGVNIRFRFAFSELRGSVIDLMLFAKFLRDAVEELFPVRSVTDGRFIVSLTDSDLNLDDWINKEQFDVSLLLESEDGRRAVEFYTDRAVISSPHTEVDDKTVEYIRAVLLNYYL